MITKEILEVKSNLETDLEILIEEFIDKTNLILKKINISKVRKIQVILSL